MSECRLRVGVFVCRIACVYLPFVVGYAKGVMTGTMRRLVGSRLHGQM